MSAIAAPDGVAIRIIFVYGEIGSGVVLWCLYCIVLRIICVCMIAIDMGYY